MKRKILSVMLTVVLALGVVFTAVGCASALEKYYKTADETYAPYSAATEVTALAGFEEEEQAGDLVLFEKQGVDNVEKAIFDLNKGSVIATFTVSDEDEIELIELPAVGQTLYKTKITKADETKPTHKLYSQAAIEIASVTTDNFGGCYAKLDLVKFDNAVYRVAEDGSVVKAFDVSDLGSFSLYVLDYKAGGYYYGMPGNNESIMIFVFNEKGEVVSYYKAPSFAGNSFDWYVLNNGNIFVQYVVAEDMFGENYDYRNGNSKYTLEQYVINPKNGDAKSVKDSKNPIIINHVAAADVMSAYEIKEGQGSIKNFATGYKIVDKMIDQNEVYFEMSNSGKLSEIEDFIPAQLDVYYANGYYVATNELNQTFLYNSDAKLIGEISGMEGGNIKFLYTAKAVYDYNLNKVLDLEDYTVKATLESTLILSKTVTVDNDEVVKYYLLKEGAAPAEICKAANMPFNQYEFMVGRKYYIVINNEINNEVKLDCYNEVGTKLLTVDMTIDNEMYTSVDEAKMLVKLGDAYYYVA
jgi:hypothetical protein